MRLEMSSPQKQHPLLTNNLPVFRCGLITTTFVSRQARQFILSKPFLQGLFLPSKSSRQDATKTGDDSNDWSNYCRCCHCCCVLDHVLPTISISILLRSILYKYHFNIMFLLYSSCVIYQYIDIDIDRKRIFILIHYWLSILLRC